jgi:hypothetical protein
MTLGACKAAPCELMQQQQQQQQQQTEEYKNWNDSTCIKTQSALGPARQPPDSATINHAHARSRKSSVCHPLRHAQRAPPLAETTTQHPPLKTVRRQWPSPQYLAARLPQARKPTSHHTSPPNPTLPLSSRHFGISQHPAKFDHPP